jgi:hypothetical protein
MLIRADQLMVGDHLRDCEVIWVLPTPSRDAVVVGLQQRWPRRGGPARLTARYDPRETLAVMRSRKR